MRTRSSSWTTGASSSAGLTSSCWPEPASTTGSTAASSPRRSQRRSRCKGGRAPPSGSPPFLGFSGHLRCSPSGLGGSVGEAGKGTHTLGPSPCLHSRRSLFRQGARAPSAPGLLLLRGQALGRLEGAIDPAAGRLGSLAPAGREDDVALHRSAWHGREV